MTISGKTTTPMEQSYMAVIGNEKKIQISKFLGIFIL